MKVSKYLPHYVMTVLLALSALEVVYDGYSTEAVQQVASIELPPPWLR